MRVYVSVHVHRGQARTLSALLCQALSFSMRQGLSLHLGLTLSLIGWKPASFSNAPVSALLGAWVTCMGGTLTCYLDAGIWALGLKITQQAPATADPCLHPKGWSHQELKPLEFGSSGEECSNCWLFHEIKFTHFSETQTRIKSYLFFWQTTVLS